MPIRFIDEQPPEPASTKIRFVDEPAQPAAASSTATPGLAEELARQGGLFLRSGAQAVTAVPRAMADFATGLVNLGSMATGGGQVIQPTSQAFDQFLTQIGLPQPATALERAVSAGTEAVGSMGTQAAMAAKSGVQALQPLAQNIPQQAVAAATGGAAGQSVGEVVGEQTESPLAATIASVAAGTLAGGSAARAVRGKEAPVPTLQQIKDRARQNYQVMEQSGIEVKPASVYRMLSSARSELASENFNPRLDTHRPVAQLLDQLNEMVDNRRVSFTKLEQMRSAATAMSSATDPATRRLAAVVRESIDNFIGNIKPNDVLSSRIPAAEASRAVLEARKDWRNLSRAQVIEDALNTAEVKALDPKASEGELIRRQLINLAADKRKMRFFTEEERNAIKAVARGGKSDPLLSLVARFNPERSQIMAGGQLALSTQTPAGAIATAAGGFAADKLLSAQRTQAAQRLMQGIAAGQPPVARPDFFFRGLLSAPAAPLTEQDLEAIRALR